MKNFARFEDWQRLCRFPLIWLGLADPCATRDNIEASDPEREKLRVLLTAWYEHFGERIVTIKEVISAATASVVSLRDAIEMAVPAEKGGVLSSLKLAKFIGRFVRRIEGGLRFERAVMRRAPAFPAITARYGSAEGFGNGFEVFEADHAAGASSPQAPQPGSGWRATISRHGSSRRVSTRP